MARRWKVEPCSITVNRDDEDVRDISVSEQKDKRRRGPITAAELMAQLEADHDWVRARDQRDAARRARMAENADEFALVRGALDAAGLPSRDFGHFTSGRYPEIIPQPIFDYRGAVPVLLDVLPNVTRPAVKEAIVRSLSTAYARPYAARALLDEFRKTSNADQPTLKWAIGNALSTVTTHAHVDELLELARDRRHGAGRGMVVERLGRISGNPRVEKTLMKLIDDPDVAFQAMGGIRRRLGPAKAAELLEPLTAHQDERVRRAAHEHLKRARKAMIK